MTTINTQELKYEPQLSLNEFTEDSQVHLKELVCPLCKGIYVDPILDSCAHIYCHKCDDIYINNYKIKYPNKKALCPLSNLPLELANLKAFNFINDIIKKQKSFCKNKDFGCEWVGLYILRKNHIENECVFQKINCLNKGCECKFMRKEQKEHDKICEYLLVECEKCKNLITKKEFNNHYLICPKEKINCECGKVFYREEKENHSKTECPFVEIICPFNIYGCNEKFMRKNEDEHLDKYVLKHNDLIVEWFLNWKKNKETQIEMKEKELLDENEKLNKVVDSLKKYCDDMELDY